MDKKKLTMPLSLLVLLISMLQLQLVKNSQADRDIRECDDVNSYEESNTPGIKIFDALQSQKAFINVESVSIKNSTSDRFMHAIYIRTVKKWHDWNRSLHVLYIGQEDIRTIGSWYLKLQIYCCNNQITFKVDQNEERIWLRNKHRSAAWSLTFTVW